MQDWALISGANNQLRPKRCDLHGFDQMDVKTEWETHLPAVLLRRSSRIVILSRVSRSFTRLSVHCAVFTEHHPTAGAGSVPARPVTVPARYWLGPRRCRLGSRLCWLGAGSVTAGAGSVPARIPPVPACPARLSSRQTECRLGAGSVPACACPVPVPILVYPDETSSTPKGSISIDSPELRLHPGNASISESLKFRAAAPSPGPGPPPPPRT